MKNRFALFLGIDNYIEIRNRSGYKSDVERISGFHLQFAKKMLPVQANPPSLSLKSKTTR